MAESSKLARRHHAMLAEVFRGAPMCIFTSLPGSKSAGTRIASTFPMSWQRIPALVAIAGKTQWSTASTACALSATAAAKGQHELAEALLDLTSPDTVGEFLEWSNDR